jgi:hypothetical protein
MTLIILSDGGLIQKYTSFGSFIRKKLVGLLSSSPLFHVTNSAPDTFS